MRPLHRPADPSSPATSGPASTPEREPAARTPVLLTEDNPVNATVVSAIAGRHGYRIEVAPDGSEALDLLERRRYAAILMDCHMPRMDGYTATEEIRRRENGGPRTPIIALTASTMKGDREACLAAGMDDYVAKPVRSDQLRDVLERWTRGGDHPMAAPASDPAPGGRPSADLLDPAILQELEVLGPHGFAHLVSVFAEDAGRRLEELRAVVERGDLCAARGIAHAVKGSAGAIGAGAMARRAGELERSAATTDRGETLRLLPMLEDLFGPSLDALRADAAFAARPG